MMYRKFTMAAVCVIAAMMASSASAALFFDDFNDDGTGVLAGETANTGQVWENIVGSPLFGSPAGLSTDVSYGQGSTGIGVTTQGFSVSMAPLGTTLNTGEWVLSADIRMATIGQEVALYLTDNATSAATVGWVDSNIFLQGFFNLNPGSLYIPVGFDAGNLHIDVTMNLDDQTGSVSWFDIDNPGTNGTMNNPIDPGPYNFQYVAGQAFRDSSGIDNISLSQVPEPASLMLLATGCLALVLRRKR